MRRTRHRRRYWRSPKTAYDHYYRAELPRHRRSLRERWGSLSRETRRGIWSVLVLGVSLTMLLALLGLAGPVSGPIRLWLAQGFGFARWVLLILLFSLGYVLIRPNASGWMPLRWLGAVVALAAVAGLSHLGAVTLGWTAVVEGRGGGLLGYGVTLWLSPYLSAWAIAIMMIAVAVVGGLLCFNTSFAQVAAAFKTVRAFVANIRQSLIRRRVRKLQLERESASTSSAPAAETPKLSQRDVPVTLDVEEGGTEDAAADTGSADAGDEISAAPKPPRRNPRKLDLPLTLLNGQAGKPTSGDIKANQYIIEKTLKNFGIEVEMGEVSVGPTVTQYTFKPAEGVRLSKIVSLSDNLALALAAHPIRIEAPIPGRSLVGIEVPNQTTAVVPLHDVLDSSEFRQRKTNLMVALGTDVKGKPWLADLGKMPHLLIAGATGSGKSVCINAVILSLIYQNGPDDLKFIMVDPKRVELPIYNSIPHLITPVITDVKKTVSALRWCIHEMERRFDTLAAVHKRDIGAYNQAVETKMPYLVVVIDELADLMAAAGPEIEGSIIRLAQMSRAVGIHLVIATQRPSVDVLTGLIKANITTRIAFSVASLVDSRTILDMSGAEKLLGRGDMLYLSAEIAKPKRLQGAYAMDGEIKRVIDHLKTQAQPEYDQTVVEIQTEGNGWESGNGGGEDEAGDELLSAATDVIVRAGKASASLLQRRLRVGYARAARILDLLEQRGVVGPADGAKPREVMLRRGVEGATIEHEQESTPDDVADDGGDAGHFAA
ncbi:MAG: DNA translocase FtsK [Patescibacteria group bacterium]|nr:DNA translocase FtsK [Patescibacteria group bacterium]